LGGEWRVCNPHEAQTAEVAPGVTEGDRGYGDGRSNSKCRDRDQGFLAHADLLLWIGPSPSLGEVDKTLREPTAISRDLSAREKVGVKASPGDLDANSI
jgi:hypothetical protein